MRYLYTGLFYLLVPLIWLRLWLRGRKNPAYLVRIGERFGYYRFPPYEQSLWIHAVSYGEVVAAERLIKRLKTAFPKYSIVITTMTPSGAARVQQNLSQVGKHIYIPYDLPGAVQRFFNHFKPKVAILMETELWPNLIHYAHKKNIPIILANARLSDRSFHRYKKFVRSISSILNQLQMVLAQSTQDTSRFQQLGVAASKLHNVGNIKYDVEVPEAMIEQGKKLRQNLAHEFIWVVASTHKDEEKIILEVFKQLLPHKNALLIIVPRHPERFETVYKLCQHMGFSVWKRSDGFDIPPNTQVLLGDSMGELYLYYGMGDVATVGGSFVPVGGHNLLEPAAVKLPIVTGPYLTNFAEMKERMLANDALQIAPDGEELLQLLLHYMNDEELRRKHGENAYEVMLQNGGALERHLQWVAGVLNHSAST